MIYSAGCEYGIRALMNMAREAPDGRHQPDAREVEGARDHGHRRGRVPPGDGGAGERRR